MKSTFSYFLFFASLLSIQVSGQQPSKEQIDALLKNAQRMVDSLAKAQKAKNPGSTGDKSIPSSYSNMAGAFPSKSDTSSFRPPPRNGGLLGSLPKQKLSTEQLKAFITGVDKKLTAIIQNTGVQLPAVDQLDAGTIWQTAIMDLLQGGNEETAWLAIKAIEKAPGNILVLNNCGAILNGCGFQPIAIPVLETALEKSPGNSTVQNNLGQAYVALGEVEKATSYLQQCIRKSPKNPHANFALACIYHSKGDDGSALNYVENSLRGGFTDGAWHLLGKLKKDSRMMDYLKNRYQPPEYFDEDKYHLPLQCESVADIPLKRGEYTAYHTMVESAKRQMNDLANDEFAQGKKAMQENVRNYKPGSIVPSGSFNELASAMLLSIAKKMTDDGGPEIGRQQQKYREDMKSLSDEYEKKLRDLHDCTAQTGLANDYMEKMAMVTTDYQKAYLRIWKEFYSENIFWGSFSNSDPHVKKGFFCRYAAGLLAVLSDLAKTSFLQPCGQIQEIKKDTVSLVVPEPDCPIDIDFKCIVGSFHIDCEKINFKTKAGLILNVDHSFKNHNTTIAIGAGVDLSFGERSAGPISGEFGAAGNMKFFMSFCGTRACDLGVTWKTSVSYKEEITNPYGFKNITTTDMDYGAGTTLSVVNGWTFEGKLYKDLDKLLGVPPEKQENKNVKIYK